jgi:hypothetical protein
VASRARVDGARPWPVLRTGLYGAIAGAFLALFLTFAALLGGSVTGLAFWGRLGLGAVAGLLVSAGFVALRNRVART